MRVALVGVVLLGCQPYQPGSFAASGVAFAGERVTIGCLELAVARRGDDGLRADVVLDYRFGNRCDGPTLVDLAHVRVVGRDAAGDDQVLYAYDPRAELVPLRLPGRYAGHEAIAYRAGARLEQVCVDLASIAGAKSEQWACFAAPAPELDTLARAEVP